VRPVAAAWIRIWALDARRTWTIAYRCGVALGSDLCHMRPEAGRASIVGVRGHCSMAVCRKGEGALR